MLSYKCETAGVRCCYGRHRSQHPHCRPTLDVAETRVQKRASVTSRPTAEERQIIDRLSDEGAPASDAVRRGLHLVAHEKWLDEARAHAHALANEDLSDEPDAW